MIRIVLEILVPLLLPTMIYLGWRKWRAGQTPTTGEEEDGPPPWLWLGGSGVALMLIFLAVMALTKGAPAGAQYTPPVFKDGKVEPGRLE